VFYLKSLGAFTQGRILWGIHGLPKVSLGPTMPECPTGGCLTTPFDTPCHTGLGMMRIVKMMRMISCVIMIKKHYLYKAKGVTVSFWRRQGPPCSVLRVITIGWIISFYPSDYHFYFTLNHGRMARGGHGLPKVSALPFYTPRASHP
jgi:hypothetical protein